MGDQCEIEFTRRAYSHLEALRRYQRKVTILAVGLKNRNKLIIEGKEVAL